MYDKPVAYLLQAKNISAGLPLVVQSSDALSSNFQGEAYGEQIRDFGKPTNMEPTNQKSAFYKK